MGKKAGKVSRETPVYLGTTDVRKAKRDYILFFIVLSTIAIADLSAAGVLYACLHQWRFILWPSVRAFLQALYDFRGDGVDLLVLGLVRFFSLLCIFLTASRFAWEEGQKDDKVLKARATGTAPPKSPKAARADDLTTPLLSGTAAPSSPLPDIRGPRGPARGKGQQSGKLLSWRSWVRQVSRTDIALFSAYLLSTVFQVFVGVKCVNFEFSGPDERLQGLLMGSGVLWINLQSSLLGHVVGAYRVLSRARRIEAGNAKRSAGQVSVGTTASTPWHSLDPVAAAELLREHTMRGDKGLRTEADLDQRMYLMRAVALSRAHWPLVLLGFCCLTLTSAAALILPKIQGRILDRVIKADPVGFRADVSLLIGWSLVSGLFGGVRGLCFSVVAKRVLKNLQDKLFAAVIVQDIAYFDATTSGEVTSRLTTDVASMAEPLNWMLSTLLRNCAALGGGLFMCFWTSWKLAMLAFTTMAPIMHITALYSRWSREQNRKRSAVLAEANSAAAEALGNIRTVRAFSSEEVEVARFQGKTSAALQRAVGDAVAYSGTIAINSWLDLGASVLILWYGGMLVMDGRLSVGQLVTFQLYWGLIQGGYQSIMSVLMSLTRASGAAQRVLAVIDALPDIDPAAGTKVSTLTGLLQLDGVHFHYQMRADRPVLAGVDLSIPAGTQCALVGRSGSGKSTIIHLLMRFYDPTRGRVLVDGYDLRDLNLKTVHKHIGLVAQDTQLWATTIEENLAYGLPSYTREDIEEAARVAHAHDFIMSFPEGYATRVGERGVRLSGGQRQRIAIARMVLRKPRVLLLDEATSALDAESEALVQRALDDLLARGGMARTVVIVAHRLSTVRNADAIAVMARGEVAEYGRHEELLEMNGVYAGLVERQLCEERVLGVPTTVPTTNGHKEIEEHALEDDPS